MYIISNESIIHSGVPGMKWGRRKSPGIDTGTLSKAKALGLGIYGNKSRFTDPHALQQRKTAGKLRIAAISTAMGASVSSIVGSTSHNQGLIALSSLLYGTSGVLNIAGAVNATVAINNQQQADAKK